MYPRIFDSLPSPTVSIRPTRRGFMLGAVASGLALTVGFRWIPGAQAQETPASHPVNPYISIAADGKVTIYSSQFEMGQGAYFGIATLVNEELDADWAQITVDGGYGNVAAYGNLAWGGAAQGTGGSTSMTSSWERYRTAGAALRMMLAEAAAKEWSVPVTEITTAKGILSHASGKTATYGDMVAKASALPVPESVPLKPRSAWTQIGNADLKRYDSRMKTDGSAQFTIDVKLPQMATAVMIHPPKFGATVASFDASKAKDVKGFVQAVQISRGVAVVAETMWAALKARDLVSVTWNEDKAEQRSSADILSAYEAQSKAAPLAVARNDGDAAAALASADKVLEASFSFPYLAHAALEPLNAVASMTDGTLEIWAGHQMPDLYQFIASQIAGTTPDKVRLHVMRTGGGFGRRAVFDADVVSEAVETAKALGWSRPVKVQWTRENDMRGGRYRPAYVHAMKAGPRQGWPDRRLVEPHRRPVDHVGHAVRGDGGQERHRLHLGRGCSEHSLCHSQPQRRAFDHAGGGPRTLVAGRRLDAHGLRGRSLPRRSGRGCGQGSRGTSPRTAREAPAPYGDPEAGGGEGRVGNSTSRGTFPRRGRCGVLQHGGGAGRRDQHSGSGPDQGRTRRLRRRLRDGDQP